MNVLIITLGSSGDVNPFVGLGVGLKSRGHRVTLATNPHFQSSVEKAGLDFAALGTADEYLAALADPDLWHPHRALKLVINRLILRSLQEAFDVVKKHRGHDTVIVASSLMAGARVSSESFNIPLVTVDLQPGAIWSVQRPPVSSSINLPEGTPYFIRKLFFNFIERFMLDPMIAPGVNSFRAEAGLPPVKNVFSKWLHSPRKTLGLFPEWFAGPAPDWPSNIALTGFILNDAGGHIAMPVEAEIFLESGEPPIVFTPGTAMQQGEAFFKAAVGAARMLGRRALLLTGHRGHLPSALPEGVAHFSYLPFGRVFPKAAAVVHHGGIGTCAQALAAGVPQLVMPMAHDQPDNAARLQRLGVAEVLPPNKFTAASVAGKLKLLISSNEIRTKCKDLAGRIDPEKTLNAACEEIEKIEK